MKTLIRHRHCLSKAQFKYNQSLHSVATAIGAFQREKQSQLLISEPIPEDEKTEEEESSDGDDEEREVCAHFYDDDSFGEPLMQNSAEENNNNNFGWDFFNLFEGVRTEVVNAGYGGGGGEKKYVAAVPPVDAKVSRGDGDMAGDANVSQGGEKEMFEGLKEVEESFVKLFEKGEEVSRMLEVGAVHHLDPGLDKYQESPRKSPILNSIKSPFQCSPMKSPFLSPMKSPFQSISWGRSTSSSSSSCKSLFAFSSCSSTWTDANTDWLDEHNGMVSGSHSQTLGRLYAWESKLYEEVKVGEHMRKIYQQKCLQLKNLDSKCKGTRSPEKTKAEMRDLHSRILVVIRRVESISQRIKKVKDEELQPQLLELLNGLMIIWKNMLETHTAQKQAISEIKMFSRKNFEEFGNISHRMATFQLATEVQNWSHCFAEYLSTHKAYVETLHSWFSKCTSPQAKSQSRGKFSISHSIDGPPLIFITREWLNFLMNLPDKPVISAMKSFIKDVRAIWVQQGDEQLQKRKVDGLQKELDRGINALQKEEKKVTENVSYRVDYINERKHLVGNLRKKLELEKEKHRESKRETEKMGLRIFQNGFGSVFDALVEFSKASLQMYGDVLKSENKSCK